MNYLGYFIPVRADYPSFASYSILTPSLACFLKSVTIFDIVNEGFIEINSERSCNYEFK
jgi:hypothetical protein